jgi:hypothetical protein
MALGLIVIGVGTFAAINPGEAEAFRRVLYPDGPAKRQAPELLRAGS